MSAKACLLGLLALLAAAEVHANASCTPAPPVALSIASISVPANPRVGQVLGDPQGYALQSPDAQDCTYGVGVSVDHWSYISVARNMRFTGKYFGLSGLSLPIFTTGLQGVGYGLMAQDRDGGEWKSINQGVSILRGPLRPGLASWGVRVRVVFFVTGAIQGGVVFAQPFAEFRVHPDFHAVHLFTFATVVVGPPLKPTCSVSTPSVPIDLGSVAATAFTGVGSVAGGASREIELQCAGGTGGRLDVWVTLTDQTQPANRGERLTLTQDSTARGLALQLLHGNAVVSYGPDASGIGNPNQWSAGSTGNGTVRIPLTARYLQTEPTVHPGTAKGLATFTLSYR
ncbi:type 1 fimbrial protein [Pseudomonas sp. WS 5111]|jgi:type 1 fimbria pilin|uniref:fimbrial protein n=1 Tax=unclassified Pseudomonas TaxID=196821 RepID=UPI001473B4F9|nr:MULTISPECIES: fimbrial protein [unclassified Pseudomonas]NMX60081.1 type 1 fimbrial protein [Pseudomonas sp. WS 5079]NMX70202.1 type 1 fimbrial protein [Pseudomonas sp. WS 5111]NMX85551.1 type 1 fimbrial protein [Pseudomonas sp. WS 5010]